MKRLWCAICRKETFFKVVKAWECLSCTECGRYSRRME
jgi:Txe/YoeB family toxin of Txe-Axe toxin-antitoxin module